ncbi:unnamed protein product [Oikopleura dioica]|uniref:CUB domain-containing protein n=1 Tax=Oikopleura dioica TaxID=34765 RepID=E4XW48_OIKDI|nr:unnamed protein product [Oikopleura dioica]
MTLKTVFFALCSALPPMRWDISSCVENKLRAEGKTNQRIVVSQSFPNAIQVGWNCEYEIYVSDPNDRIIIEFQHFSMHPSCEIQNLTITDVKTKREAGPYCGSDLPLKFVSDSTEVSVKTFTGENSGDIDTEGFMYNYWKVPKEEAIQPVPISTTSNSNSFGNGGMFMLNPGPSNSGFPNSQSPFQNPGSFPFGPGMSSPGGNFPEPRNVMANGVPMIGPSGQQATIYSKKDSDDPSAPEIKSNLPGGSTGYIQPNYEKNREELELMNLWEDGEESTWTVPKIIGVAAAGLCLLSLIAAGFQIYMTRKEKKVKRRIQRNSDSNSSFSSFDSYDEHRQQRKEQRRKKKQQTEELQLRNQKISRANKDLKAVQQSSFDKNALHNAERAIQIKKLQEKLEKYK